MNRSTDTFTPAAEQPWRDAVARLWAWHGLRWRQRLLRVVAAAAMAAVIAYAALPWWLPTGVLKQWVAEDMARQMGVEVTIDELSVSWRNGVHIRGLTVGAPPGFGDEPMLVVEQIHTEFAPLRYLIAKRIESMEISQPRLLVIVQPDGTSNIAALMRLEFEVDARHISVREAVATFDLPGRESRTQLNVNSIRFDAGRRQRIGTVALSAELQQTDGAATISLRVDPGDNPAVAARATFSFTDVDLERLALPALLHLPISKLAGACSGSVELQIDRTSVIDQFALHLSVVDLKVQPTHGPELPVIDRANVDITATYDPLAPDGRLQIHSMRISLPEALELTGRAVVYIDVLGENWRAIESLELTGSVSLSRLAEIFTGQPSLGERDVALTGPVSVTVSARRTRTDLHLRVGIDATAAVLTRGADILKPPGRALLCELAGTLNERSDTLYIHDDSYVVLGGNRLRGFGTMRNVRQQLDRMRAGEHRLALRQVMASVAAADWTGGIELRDHQAIGDLLPQLAPALADLTLDGPVAINWSVFERAGRRIEMHVSVPAETQLSIGEWFAKPDGTPVTLTFAAAIDQAEGALADIDIDLTCGRGRVTVDNGWAVLARDSGQPDGSIKLAGSFTAERFEAIAGLFPLLTGHAAGSQGRFRGRYHATYDPATGSGEAEANIRDLQVVWGTEADELGRDPNLPGGLVSGDIVVHAERTGDGVLTISLDGDALEARIASADVSRYKRAGTRLRGKVTISPAHPSDSRQADTVTIEVAFGDSELTIRQPAGPTDEQAVRSYQATLAIDEALLAMLPELAAFAEAINLRGKVRLAGDLPLDAAAVELTADVDASDLAFQLDSRLIKPRGATMEAFLRASIAEDGSVAVSIERGLLGRVSITGQVDVGPARADGLQAHRVSSGQLLLTTEHGESLGEFVPELADRLLAGRGQVQLQWTADAASADIHWQAMVDELIYRHNDKDIHLAGDLAAVFSVRPTSQDAADADGQTLPPSGYSVTIESIRTEALEFLIDDYHGFVVAYLADLSHQPAGSIRLLADRLDSKALADWLGGGGGGPRPDTFTLSEAEEHALDQQASAVIAAIRPYLLNGRFQLHVSIDDLRTYDDSVEQFYDLRNFSAAATVEHGYIVLEYAAGLNSGTLRRRYQTYLGEDAPMVRYEGELIDVIARENIRPQIALSFPGNTVTGFFSRRDSLEMTLRAVIANSIDWRYPLRPTGHAKTVAIEGVTKGQAAPEFITRIFPGLNTTRYEYRRMTAFADYGEDGVVINDMVFDGLAYDLYMDGTTDADNIGRYEIGVILLGQPQSAEWNHTYRQGRIPILKFEGRIENGELHEVTVSYPWPNEAFYSIFMKNNYFYRVWLEQRRRQRGQ